MQPPKNRLYLSFYKLKKKKKEKKLKYPSIPNKTLKSAPKNLGLKMILVIFPKNISECFIPKITDLVKPWIKSLITAAFLFHSNDFT